MNLENNYINIINRYMDIDNNLLTEFANINNEFSTQKNTIQHNYDSRIKNHQKNYSDEKNCLEKNKNIKITDLKNTKYSEQLSLKQKHSNICKPINEFIDILKNNKMIINKNIKKISKLNKLNISSINTDNNDYIDQFSKLKLNKKYNNLLIAIENYIGNLQIFFQEYNNYTFIISRYKQIKKALTIAIILFFSYFILLVCNQYELCENYQKAIDDINNNSHRSFYHKNLRFNRTLKNLLTFSYNKTSAEAYFGQRHYFFLKIYVFFSNINVSDFQMDMLEFELRFLEAQRYYQSKDYSNTIRLLNNMLTFENKILSDFSNYTNFNNLYKNSKVKYQTERELDPFFLDIQSYIENCFDKLDRQSSIREATYDLSLLLSNHTRKSVTFNKYFTKYWIQNISLIANECKLTKNYEYCFTFENLGGHNNVEWKFGKTIILLDQSTMDLKLENNPGFREEDKSFSIIATCDSICSISDHKSYSNFSFSNIDNIQAAKTISGLLQKLINICHEGD